jgi:hypothetical protein
MRRQGRSKGRRYWGPLDVNCRTCWESYLGRVEGANERVQKWLREAEHCPECAGTQREPIPWSELFRNGRLGPGDCG